MQNTFEPIKRYGIVIRSVEISDAEFILKLRTDKELGRFISPTSPNFEDQVNWIQEYKIREKAGLEYYFIAQDLLDNRYGTIRLYNFDDHSFEIGSWLFRSDSPIGMAVKAHFIGFEIGFEILNKKYSRFEIRKKNEGVLKYMENFETTLVGENELNYYYILSKENFYRCRNKLSIFGSTTKVVKKVAKEYHTVLLGSAGVGTAYASAKALRKYFNVKIIACDTNPAYLVTANLFADYYEKIAPVASKSFDDEIVHILNKYNIDTYIPFIDQEVYSAALLYEKGKIGKDVSLQLKQSSFVEICMDKYKAYQWLSANNLPTPNTSIVKDKNDLKIGFILKPRKGFGSVIQKITSIDETKAANYEDFIMQESCIAPEITIDVHYSQQFDFFSFACRERIETKSGVCTKARIFFDESLGEIALMLAKKLDLSSFCFQVMTLNNEFVITDINPRLGAGTAMSSAVGLDFFGAMFANLWDQNPEKYFTKSKEEKYVTRQYCEFVM